MYFPELHDGSCKRWELILSKYPHANRYYVDHIIYDGMSPGHLLLYSPSWRHRHSAIQKVTDLEILHMAYHLEDKFSTKNAIWNQIWSLVTAGKVNRRVLEAECQARLDAKSHFPDSLSSCHLPQYAWDCLPGDYLIVSRLFQSETFLSQIGERPSGLLPIVAVELLIHPWTRSEAVAHVDYTWKERLYAAKFFQFTCLSPKQQINHMQREVDPYLYSFMVTRSRDYSTVLKQMSNPFKRNVVISQLTIGEFATLIHQVSKLDTPLSSAILLTFLDDSILLSCRKIVALSIHDKDLCRQLVLDNKYQDLIPELISRVNDPEVLVYLMSQSGVDIQAICHNIWSPDLALDLFHRYPDFQFASVCAINDRKVIFDYIFQSYIPELEGDGSKLLSPYQQSHLRLLLAKLSENEIISIATSHPIDRVRIITIGYISSRESLSLIRSRLYDQGNFSTRGLDTLMLNLKLGISL